VLVLIALALVTVVIVALVVGFALHLLFSPWLLLAAIAIVAWVKLRPRSSHR
jgi:hypothetical protein